MGVEEFENNWNNFSDELTEIFESKIKNEEDVKHLISKLNFYIIDIIDNEVICSAVKNDDLLICHINYENNGKLEIKVKAKELMLKQEFFSEIKNFL